MPPVKTTAALLALALLVPPPTSAAPLRLRLGWDDMRAVATHAEIAPRVVVWLAPGARKRVKGHLVEITDAGITLRNPRNNNPQTQNRYVSRQDVHTVRLAPVKGERFRGHPYRWRLAAVAAAFPVWLGAYYLGVSLGGIREGPIFKTKDAWHGLVLAFGLPYGLYRLAWRADRGRGAIFIEVDHGQQAGNETWQRTGSR